MYFMDIANTRQSCRKYDADRPVEEEKLQAVLAAARLAPSACNGQSYHITVCTGELAKEVAQATTGMGMNKFAAQAPVMLVFSDVPYVKTAAFGSKVKNIDYRCMDIGLAAAYLTAEATVQGLGSCILGWLDSDRIGQLCDLDSPVRMAITLGYAHPDDPLRKKIRKDLSELVTYK